MADISLHMANVPPSSSFSCEQIMHYLKTKTDEYTIIDETREGVKANFWKMFGYPAKKNDTNEMIRIPGFISCRKCRKTFSFNRTTGTSHLNSHRCVLVTQPSISFNGSVLRQTSLEKTWASVDMKSVKLSEKEKTTIKDLCSKWICQDIRPFSIIEDDGLQNLIQECIHLGERRILP